MKGHIVMEFKPISTEEQAKLFQALRDNAATGKTLHMRPNDTTFDPDNLHDEEVIAAIRSVPCHYFQ